MAGENYDYIHYRGQIIDSEIAKIGIESALGIKVINVFQKDDTTLAYKYFGNHHGEISIADILPKSTENCLIIGAQLREPQERQKIA